MELEDRLALRLAYIKSLPPLLEAAGLRMCRWSKRLLRVCGRYFEVAGYSEQEEASHAILVRELMLIVSKVKTHHAHLSFAAAPPSPLHFTFQCFKYFFKSFCFLYLSDIWFIYTVIE
jgi:hypothetical protein